MTVADIKGDANSARRRRAAYVALRLSGVLLAVLVLGHFVATHVTTDVADTDSRFIDQRWATALWLVWDGVMLAATLGHAVLGLWAVIADYTAGRRRRIWRVVLLCGAGAVLVGGMTLLWLAATAS
ncbi:MULTISPECIES: succinate dehydrogenase hydrophobic membrane anchor protein [Prauserella salsuginis group]|uniref:Succinate dehydrogenase hydrophobic anchor subunit n=2 Tax=Prauserella salsuginis group TaxID=2893672 RepID=A0A839XRZ4_9PSEU|nr:MULTISPECIES: succinate dehydrogenase hydrophobic membrane anchor protein [Prauserella salsuginis group]MBB3664214.1 succinate dehydrogenase hydrophobic anchor subunit [Prauserella sediminis]MCR3721663.1 succinate dehydrogenase / fumarate reductase membrane anchor subunit [Prauserella flava]MCR3734355.1 succinate dehydrogenase / fumarate reductase membrane anchor subunit [Prauserella salsuginis]